MKTGKFTEASNIRVKVGVTHVSPATESIIYGYLVCLAVCEALRMRLMGTVTAYLDGLVGVHIYMWVPQQVEACTCFTPEATGRRCDCRGTYSLQWRETVRKTLNQGLRDYLVENVIPIGKLKWTSKVLRKKNVSQQDLRHSTRIARCFVLVTRTKVAKPRFFRLPEKVFCHVQHDPSSCVIMRDSRLPSKCGLFQLSRYKIPLPHANRHNRSSLESCYLVTISCLAARSVGRR